MEEFKVHVLFRCSKKTGKVDTTMTGITTAMMKMWALTNTPKTKACMIIERDTGKVTYLTQGGADGWPKVKKGDLGSCESYGIPLEAVQAITDERFDQ